MKVPTGIENAIEKLEREVRNQCEPMAVVYTERIMRRETRVDVARSSLLTAISTALAGPGAGEVDLGVGAGGLAQDHGGDEPSSSDGGESNPGDRPSSLSTSSPCIPRTRHSPASDSSTTTQE
jgi:hypothetical protein